MEGRGGKRTLDRAFSPRARASLRAQKETGGTYAHLRCSAMKASGAATSRMLSQFLSRCVADATGDGTWRGAPAWRDRSGVVSEEAALRRCGG